ncbi:hypothetical protein BCD96_003000 [Clostridium beijerinckii]|uniref:Uncharacterized protein n=1 Tax=Clostridium beijerinckii TaxID=1520 RepID=A0AAX0AVE4_CLOBE|nr:hypothetical protein [Clostridium beijerinckii]NRT35685.1 hypothetical protein [Clostridium beijerinckii]NRT44887.1 hypothetical protein [Clostridium beijerinckii]NRT86938.1 hypothetical protein [Clostridium beijerinckii]NRU38614.1 hypothetical protein [Clostridium beijerinckii]
MEKADLKDHVLEENKKENVFAYQRLICNKSPDPK